MSKSLAQQELSLANMLNQQLSYMESGDYKAYLDISKEIAVEYYNNYQSDSSIIVLKQALDYNYDKSVSDSLISACHHQLGISYYDNLEDSIAIEEWQKAINLRKRFLPHNHEDLIKGYRNIANAYFEQESYSRAEIYFNKALQLNYSRDSIIKKKEAQLNSELGSLYTSLQNIDKANRHLLIAEALYHQEFQDDKYELTLIYNNLYLLHKLKKDHQKMIEYASKSIALYDDEISHEEDYLNLAVSQNNLAIAYELNGELRRAIDYYKKTIKLCRTRLKDEAMMDLMATALSNVSTSYSEISEFKQALSAINKSIELNKLLGHTENELRSLENKAEVYLTMEKPEMALNNINAAINIISSKIEKDSSSIISQPIRVLINRTKIRILKTLHQKSGNIIHLHNSLGLIQENSTLLDKIRNNVQSDESKTFLSQEAKRIIEEGIIAYINLYREENNPEFILKAWELSEKSKSIILLETLRSLHSKKTNKIDHIYLEKEDSINHQLALIKNEIHNNPEKELELNKHYLQLSSELEEVTKYIKDKSSKHSSKTKNISDITLTESLKTLNSDIIEYFIGENSAYIFVKNNQQLACYEIDSFQMIKPLVQKIRNATIDIFSFSANKDANYNKAVKQYNQSANELYSILFNPIEEKDNLKENIIVIPDGVLGYLPFDLLLTDTSETLRFNNKPYLINKHNISYTYSIALLDEMSNIKKNRASRQLLAMAPLFESNEEVYFYGNREIKKENQPPLFFNEDEIQSIQDIMGGDIITGTDATEEYFSLNAPHYNILHLSTHGKANDDKGSFSYLAFTEILDSVENEFIYNYDLYNMELNADMVVLSACETGLGELKEGEGIISLARGFSYAGAKSIVNTLWTINDYRTKEIMEDFYRGISQGLEKDNSLRKAKLAFIRNNPEEALPFYWAAFIPVGDMSAITTNSIGSTQIILILLGLISLIYLGLRIRKDKNNQTA